MPLYEFMNKETGESVGELYLTLEKREDFLRQNPKLCVKPGKLRYAAHKSADSFPSYPDMDSETRTKEERGGDYTPKEPASWNDSDEDSGSKKYKVTDKRAVKTSHFDEDLKKYGRIVSAPKMLGRAECDFKFESVDSNEPQTQEERDQHTAQCAAKDPRGVMDTKNKLKGYNSADPINLTDTQQRMPWEKGFIEENKGKYTTGDDEDRARSQKDYYRERRILGIDTDDDEESPLDL